MAGSVPSADASGQKGITEKYFSLKKRIQREIDAALNSVGCSRGYRSECTPSSVDLSSEDLSTIANWAYMKLSQASIHPIRSDEYASDFDLADTYLKKNFAQINFNVEGHGVHTGGNINYLYVGMMAGKYRHTRGRLNLMVAGHNFMQTVDGRGMYNLSQMGGSAKYWANWGRDQFNERRVSQ